MISAENTEIKDKPHQMYAEGKEAFAPNRLDILLYLEVHGFWPINLQVFPDGELGGWYWNCDLVRVSD